MLCNAGCAKDVSNKYGVTPVYEAALKGETESSQGGTLIFSSYVGTGPISTVHTKRMSGISSTPKIIEILATQKNIPHSVP